MDENEENTKTFCLRLWYCVAEAGNGTAVNVCVCECMRMRKVVSFNQYTHIHSFAFVTHLFRFGKIYSHAYTCIPSLGIE